MSILTILTLVAVAIVVLVLVIYLVGIALYLARANRHLAKLAGGLQAIQGHARPLPEHLSTINGALRALRVALGGADRHLEGVGRVLDRD